MLWTCDKKKNPLPLTQLEPHHPALSPVTETMLPQHLSYLMFPLKLLRELKNTNARARDIPEMIKI